MAAAAAIQPIAPANRSSELQSNIPLIAVEVKTEVNSDESDAVVASSHFVNCENSLIFKSLHQ